MEQNKRLIAIHDPGQPAPRDMRNAEAAAHNAPPLLPLQMDESPLEAKPAKNARPSQKPEKHNLRA